MNIEKQTGLGLVGKILLIAGLVCLLQTAPASDYYSTQHPDWPPLPANLLGLPQTEISSGVFLLDDLNVNYAQESFLNNLESLLETPPVPGEGSGGGGDGGNGPGGRTLPGDCSGYLLPPVYQTTNLVLSLTNVGGGETYDLFTAPFIGVGTNWTYLGRWTNTAAPWVITNPPSFESYYYVACVRDTDGDGLSDGYEAGVTFTDPRDQDTDYDGITDYDEHIRVLTNSCSGVVTNYYDYTAATNAAVFEPKRLAFFRFNTSDFVGERGQTNLVPSNLQLVDAWATKGVQLTNSAAQLRYETMEKNDWTPNINLRSGTVRFWFKPLWTSGSSNAPANGARLLEAGEPGTNGWWTMYFGAAGTNLLFVSQAEGASATTNLTASLSLVSNNWYQIALTYTNGALVLYTNAVSVSSNGNNFTYPGLLVRSNGGFTLGSDHSGTNVIKGVFEDLETFNYPLNADEVLANYLLTQPPNLISSLRMWLKADSDARTNSSGRVDTWLDQSGNANHAGQSSPSALPYYIDSGIAGRPTIYFPGTSSVSFTITNSLFTNVTEAEVFMVMRAQTNTPTTIHSLWLMGATSYHQTTDGNLRDSFGSATPTDTGFPAQRVDQAHIYGVVAASNEWTLRINGVVHYTRNTNTMGFSSGPKLGDGGSGSSFQGYVSEVLIYSRRLTEIERIAVQNYLGQRFSLTTNPAPSPACLTAFAVSTNQISLGWSNVLSNTNVSFLVQRRNGTNSYSTVALLPNALSFLDSGLVANTIYSYRVKAINFAGDSTYEIVTNVSTLASGIAMPMSALVVWLKADAGHGGNPVNCWTDQTTNNYSAFFKYNVTPKAPSWSPNEMNGKPAISFYGTNGYSLPKFTSGWSQGEVFVVLKSLGVASNQYSALWLMSSSALASWHPAPTGALWEHFGRTDGNTDTGVPSGFDLTTAHLYRVAATNNSFTIWLNTGVHYSTNVNTVGFSENPTFGSGANGSMFRGHISEAMFFNRLLSTDERTAVVTNYLRQRYGLW